MRDLDAWIDSLKAGLVDAISTPLLIGWVAKNDTRAGERFSNLLGPSRQNAVLSPNDPHAGRPRKAPLGSAEFFAECARIAELTKMAGPPKPGTLGLLIAEYRASQSFLDLAVRTRADYQRCLDYLKPIS